MEIQDAPDPEPLRKRVKKLRATFARGNPEAVARVLKVPELASLQPGRMMTLAQAHLVLSREQEA